MTTSSLSRLLLVMLLFLLPVHCAWGQDEDSPPPAPADAAKATADVPEQVDIAPISDTEIEARLQSILSSTDRFEGLDVKVKNGVVFLDGTAKKSEHKEWARQLALRTTDVVAVVNNLKDPIKNIWDFSPGIQALRDLWVTIFQSLPLVGFSLVVLVLTGFIAWGVAKGVDRLLAHTLRIVLLRRVISRIVGGIVLILGIYVILQASNLTGLAATVIGGTGLLGLVLGIGFRDISENFLASLLLSIQQPFRPGDAVKIGEHEGAVQRLTTRGTLLMGWDGNFIQIPNSNVYKDIIVNKTANPKLRLDFTMNVTYYSDIAKTQEVAMKVLQEHPAVLDDPESMVLVHQLDDPYVVLRVYFWIDGVKNSALKTKSAVMRQMVGAFREAEIDWPTSSQTISIPEGVSVMAQTVQAVEQTPKEPSKDATAVATAAEGGLANEQEVVKQQAKEARLPEAGQDILTAHGNGKKKDAKAGDERAETEVTSE